MQKEINLEDAAGCYSVGFIHAIKIFLQRINDTTEIRVFPLITLANHLPAIQESGMFTLDMARREIQFIKKNPSKEIPIYNPARFDFACENCGHEFWKTELRRYPQHEGDKITCPHCASDRIKKI